MRVLVLLLLFVAPARCSCDCNEYRTYVQSGNSRFTTEREHTPGYTCTKNVRILQAMGGVIIRGGAAVLCNANEQCEYIYRADIPLCDESVPTGCGPCPHGDYCTNIAAPAAECGCGQTCEGIGCRGTCAPQGGLHQKCTRGEECHGALCMTTGQLNIMQCTPDCTPCDKGTADCVECSPMVVACQHNCGPLLECQPCDLWYQDSCQWCGNHTRRYCKAESRCWSEEYEDILSELLENFTAGDGHYAVRPTPPPTPLPTTPLPTPPPSTLSPPPSSSSSTAAVVAGVVCGVAAVALAIGVWCYCNRETPTTETEPVLETTMDKTEGSGSLAAHSAELLKQISNFLNDHNVTVPEFAGGGSSTAKGWSVIKEIGRGSSSTVFHAVAKDGTNLAVKVVNVNVSNLRTLQRELRFIMALHHPNVVSYYGAEPCYETSRLFLFMEYLDISLAKYVKGLDSALPEPAASAYTAQILQGLDYLHQSKIVHRDLKGENILLEIARGVVKIADFGCSKELKGATVDTFVGTPYFLAPEVIRGGVWSKAADIWSLGCTVAQIVNRGRPPWPAFDSPLQALYTIAQHTTLPPDLPKDVGRELWSFFEDTLQINPSDRPTAAELLNHPFITAELTTASSSTTPIPLGRWSPSRYTPQGSLQYSASHVSTAFPTTTTNTTINTINTTTTSSPLVVSSRPSSPPTKSPLSVN